MRNQNIVSPLNKAQIENYALEVRQLLGFSDYKAVDMLRLFEFILPRVFEDFVFEIVDDSELGGAEATTSLQRRHIKIQQRCYDEARRGAVRYAFTLAHELGHLLLHCGQQVALARAAHVESFRDPEWQADYFAGAFLMPAQQVRNCHSASQIARMFDVSLRAAEVRAAKLGLALPALPPSLTKKGH